MIVLDTNVLSEMMKPEGAETVRLWLDGKRRVDLFTTSVSQAEILFGLEVMAPGRRREARRAAAEGLFVEDFAGRVLPFDARAAERFAIIVADRQRAGRRMEGFDAQIAAIARAHAMAVATRDISDFRDCGVELINPWEG